MRIDLYRLIHKAQRFHLFQLGAKLGHLDWSDELQRQPAAAEVLRLLAGLREHAENEARFIHPLFGGEAVVAQLDEEHRALEAQLAGVEALVREARWSELYAGFMRFVGEYLLHLDAEERAQTETLWPTRSDAELGAVLREFRGARAPEKLADDARFMIPALSAAELDAFLRAQRGA